MGADPPRKAAERRTSLANERTDLAVKRTVFARERTFSAWVRLGLSSMAVGLAVARLFGDIGPPWASHVLGVLLIVISGMTFAIAFWRYLRDRPSFGREAEHLIPTELLAVISAGLIGAVALALYILFGS